MKIETSFKTRKAAAIYLIKRGWIHAGNNLGDWLFTKPQELSVRIIVKMNDNTWENRRYGQEMLHPSCGFKKTKTPVHANPIFCNT